MDKKEEFKNFVKNNPTLIKYVNNGEMTWQKFYEMYDMYGVENDVWNNYLVYNQNSEKINSVKTGAATFGVLELFNLMKQLDLDAVQNSIGSIQRVLGVFQEFGSSTKEVSKEEYKPRPIYKRFDD